VPTDLLALIMGRDTWWSVFAVTLIGIPIFSNAARIIPVVQALFAKGALGTVFVFMMSAIALSLPEIIILRKVLSLKLIAVFVGVVGAGVLAVGFLFNAPFNQTRRRSSVKDAKCCAQNAGGMVQVGANKLGVLVVIEKVTDYTSIASCGVSTPGIVVRRQNSAYGRTAEAGRSRQMVGYVK